MNYDAGEVMACELPVQARLEVTVPLGRGAIFGALADVESLPRWTRGWCEWVELRRGGWWAFTVLGELEVETVADDAAGSVVLGLWHVAGWRAEAAFRVKIGAGGADEVAVEWCSAEGEGAEAGERTLEAWREALAGWGH